MTSPNRAKAVQVEELPEQTNPKAGLTTKKEEMTGANLASTLKRKEIINLKPIGILNLKKDLKKPGKRKMVHDHLKQPALKMALPKVNVAS